MNDACPTFRHHATLKDEIDSFDIFPWSSDFETGIGFIDEDHQTLVRLLNTLARRLVQPETPLAGNDVLRELSDYAARHFASEGALMRQFMSGDVAEAEHLQSHQNFITEIEQLKVQSANDPQGAPIERIVAYLSHWLGYHILDVDRRMAIVVLAVQAGTPLAEAKMQAERAMSGAVRKLIEAALGMYDILSSRTLQLMKEVVERTRAEAALREQQEILTDVFENALDAVVLMNSRGIITRWNAQAEKVFGWSKAEAIGRPMDDTIVPKRHRTPHALGLAYFLATGEGPVLNKRIEIEALHRDGHEFSVELSITPIKTADGYEFSAFVRDITPTKLQKAELDKYQLHLEELVEQRTADLTVAKEAAEAANRAKTTFLAKMSHELRTPLNGIMGMTDLAKRRASDAVQANQLEIVSDSSEHLLAIINDILDISKIEAERLTLERMQFSLDKIVDKITGLFSAGKTKHGLTLVIDIAPELRNQLLLGDPLRLTQILLNLTGNAIKFAAQGSVTVRILVAEHHADHLLLRFEVSDTGAGIPPEDQRRIFDAFEQSDNSITRKFGGTGLGLAISKRLTKMMGGNIGVSSQPGVGSTFWFTALLGKAAPATDPSVPEEDPKIEALLRFRHTGARILLAEDEPISQEIVQHLLNDAGLLVDLASDGAAAVRLATQTRYALILMDMRMPVLNGVDATRQIRQLPGCAAIPIIATTANAFTEDRQTCLDAGMNDFLSKPLTPTQLYSMLLKWLGPRTQSSVAATPLPMEPCHHG